MYKRQEYQKCSPIGHRHKQRDCNPQRIPKQAEAGAYTIKNAEKDVYKRQPISWASAPGSCLIRLMNIIWRIRRPEDPRSRCTVSEARWRTDSLHNNFSYKNNVLRKPNPVGFHSTYFIISGFRCPELPAVLHLIAYGKLSQSPAQFP